MSWLMPIRMPPAMGGRREEEVDEVAVGVGA